MNLKLPLDMEIAIYYRLLEEEPDGVGIWDVEHEYPYQDHQQLLRCAEPNLQEPQLWAGLPGQLGI